MDQNGEALAFVSQLVEEEFQVILQKTSEVFQDEMQHLIVRTLWDSEKSDRYGEYYGVPATKWAPNTNGRTPPEVVIFARPLLYQYGDGPMLRKKVRKVLLHEIGHHLGLSEDDLRTRGVY